jgi:magnesium chelatase family protein
VRARIRSRFFGLDAVLVFAEVDVSNGFPGLTLVGLPDASVRESGDRVRTAIRNSGFDYPRTRITVNLSPADVRKVGAGFDLPIALGVLAAGGVVPARSLEDCLVVGELSLDGGIQPTRGVLPAMVAAPRRPAPRDPADRQRRRSGDRARRRDRRGRHARSCRGRCAIRQRPAVDARIASASPDSVAT